MNNRIAPKAIVRQLRATLDDQRPLSKTELAQVLFALNKTGIPKVFTRIDADSKYQILRQLDSRM